MKAILISGMIIFDSEMPNWMYRETPMNDDDSGWRIFSGYEDAAFLENGNNFKLISAEQLIEIDTDIKVNLIAPVGTAFERSIETGKWVLID